MASIDLYFTHVRKGKHVSKHTLYRTHSWTLFYSCRKIFFSLVSDFKKYMAPNRAPPIYAGFGLLFSFFSFPLPPFFLLGLLCSKFAELIRSNTWEIIREGARSGGAWVTSGAGCVDKTIPNTNKSVVVFCSLVFLLHWLELCSSRVVLLSLHFFEMNLHTAACQGNLERVRGFWWSKELTRTWLIALAGLLFTMHLVTASWTWCRIW